MIFDEKIEHYALEGHIVPRHDLLKTPEQIEGIRQSSKLNIAILDEIEKQIHIGMSTEEIDRLVYDMTKEMGGIPAPLGYEGFPKSVCTSINEVVCHGIPCKERLLKDGDIVNVDVSTIYQGYFSDSSRMFMLGNVDSETQKLVMSIIYDEIKQGEKGSRDKFAQIDRAVRKAGCDCAILACTELSVFATYHTLPSFYTDAMMVMAERAVERCGYPLRTI